MGLASLLWLSVAVFDQFDSSEGFQRGTFSPARRPCLSLDQSYVSIEPHSVPKRPDSIPKG